MHFLIGFMIGRTLPSLIGLVFLVLIVKAIYDTLAAMSPLALAATILGAALACFGLGWLYRRLKAAIGRRAASERAASETEVG